MLWFGTNGGVSRDEPKTRAWVTFTLKDGLAGNDVQGIAVDGLGALWFGTNGGGVSRYEPKTGAWATFTKKDGLACNDVRDIAEDGLGVLWFGTKRRRSKPLRAQNRSMDDVRPERAASADDNVQTIMVSGADAAPGPERCGGGVSRYEPKTGAWATFTKKDGLAGNDVQAIAADGLGALWFGTSGDGVSRYEPEDRKRGPP